MIAWEALVPIATLPKSVCVETTTACGPFNAVALSGMVSGLLELSLKIFSVAEKLPGPLGGLNPTPIPHWFPGPYC